MREEKLLQYLFSSKKKKTVNESANEKQKYDAHLLAFLSSDKVIFVNNFLSNIIDSIVSGVLE